MDIYIVVQEGVYRHGIFGVYTERDDAIALAKELAETDNDGYHTYEVIPFELDKRVPIDHGSWNYHTAVENERIFSARKEE